MRFSSSRWKETTPLVVPWRPPRSTGCGSRGSARSCALFQLRGGPEDLGPPGRSGCRRCGSRLDALWRRWRRTGTGSTGRGGAQRHADVDGLHDDGGLRPRRPSCPCCRRGCARCPAPCPGAGGAQLQRGAHRPLALGELAPALQRQFGEARALALGDVVQLAGGLAELAADADQQPLGSGRSGTPGPLPSAGRRSSLWARPASGAVAPVALPALEVTLPRVSVIGHRRPSTAGRRRSGRHRRPRPPSSRPSHGPRRSSWPPPSWRGPCRLPSRRKPSSPGAFFAGFVRPSSGAPRPSRPGPPRGPFSLAPLLLRLLLLLVLVPLLVLVRLLVGTGRHDAGQLVAHLRRTAVQPVGERVDLPLDHRARRRPADAPQVLAELVADLLELRVVQQLPVQLVRDGARAQVQLLPGGQGSRPRAPASASSCVRADIRPPTARPSAVRFMVTSHCLSCRRDAGRFSSRSSSSSSRRSNSSSVISPASSCSSRRASLGPDGGRVVVDPLRLPEHLPNRPRAAAHWCEGQQQYLRDQSHGSPPPSVRAPAATTPRRRRRP